MKGKARGQGGLLNYHDPAAASDPASGQVLGMWTVDVELLNFNLSCYSYHLPVQVTFCTKGPTIFSQAVPLWGEEEYTQARRGCWQDFARDRCRFQRRIRETELTISPCLTTEHRLKVYRKLYPNN